MTDNEHFVSISALTLTEPWATLMAVGEKKIETRSWGVAVPEPRPILITAAQRLDSQARECIADSQFIAALEAQHVNPLTGLVEPPEDDPVLLPHAVMSDRIRSTPLRSLFTQTRGRAVAIGILVACEQMTVQNEWSLLERVGPQEYVFGSYNIGRWLWRFEHVERIASPFRVRGALQLWRFHAESRTVAGYLAKHGFDRHGVRIPG